MKEIARRMEIQPVQGRQCFGGVIIMDPTDINFDASYTFEVTEHGKTWKFANVLPERFDYLGTPAARFEMWIAL